MSFLSKFMIITSFFLITQCSYVDKEVSKSQDKEKKILNQFLGKKSSYLKTKLGEPSKIDFKSPYKIYIYKKSQLIITCERQFYINPKKDIVEKFDSKNCINLKK